MPTTSNVVFTTSLPGDQHESNNVENPIGFLVMSFGKALNSVVPNRGGIPPKGGILPS